MSAAESQEPVPLILYCPMCHERHIDEGELATRPHRTHACQTCGALWAPAVVATVGVHYLPGCKNETPGEPETINLADLDVVARNWCLADQLMMTAQSRTFDQRVQSLVGILRRIATVVKTEVEKKTEGEEHG